MATSSNVMRSPGERPRDGVGFAVNDSEEGAGGATGGMTAFLPLMHGARVESETLGEFPPAQPHAFECVKKSKSPHYSSSFPRKSV